MRADPWMKFYPTAWRSDPRLRMCGLAARGLWIEMIALMHEASPYGHLLVAGQSPTDAQLAVLTGAPSEQIPELLGELEEAGVFSRTKEGVIYSRKMTDMAKKAAVARKNGKTGGNPSLGNKKGNSASVNPTDKAAVKPKKLEVRSKKEKKEPNGSQKKLREGEEELLAVLSPDIARAVVDHRIKIRKPLTRRAAKLLADKFQAYRNPDSAADLMIERGWQGFEHDWVKPGELARHDAPVPVATGQDRGDWAEDRWRQAIRFCRDRGDWDRSMFGPAPGEEDCEAPDHLLDQTDSQRFARKVA